jgi:hypothetical protein
MGKRIAGDPLGAACAREIVSGGMFEGVDAVENEAESGMGEIGGGFRLLVRRLGGASEHRNCFVKMGAGQRDRVSGL